jgi:hypothetical protein
MSEDDKFLNEAEDCFIKQAKCNLPYATPDDEKEVLIKRASILNSKFDYKDDEVFRNICHLYKTLQDAQKSILSDFKSITHEMINRQGFIDYRTAILLRITLNNDDRWYTLGADIPFYSVTYRIDAVPEHTVELLADKEWNEHINNRGHSLFGVPMCYLLYVLWFHNPTVAYEDILRADFINVNLEVLYGHQYSQPRLLYYYLHDLPTGKPPYHFYKCAADNGLIEFEWEGTISGVMNTTKPA